MTKTHTHTHRKWTKGKFAPGGNISEIKMEDVKYDCFVSSVSNAAIEIHIGKAQYSAVMTSGTTAICCVHKRATTYY